MADSQIAAPGLLSSKICYRRCSTEPQPIENFSMRVKDGKNGKKGELSDTCKSCMQKDRERKRKKRETEIETETETLPNVDQSDMDSFLTRVSECRENDIDISVYVDTEEYIPLELNSKERATGIATLLDGITDFHWTYRSHYTGKDFIQWTFNCAQSDSRNKYTKRPKNEDPIHTRAARQMDRADCDGWLHIVIRENDSFMKIHITHKCSHKAYENIELPQKWKHFIDEHLNMTPSKIWQEILKCEGGTDVTNISIRFRQKAVYYYWQKQVQHHWKFEDDPFTSAHKYLKERGAEVSIQLFENIVTPPGTHVLAFYVTDLMREWKMHTQEIAMDSTWNTNGQNYELFALVADAEGIGLPLSYLFVSVSKRAEAWAKTQILASWLAAVKKLGVEPEFVLTDKDQSEINAVRAVWPQSKHQLCFWHTLRAIKQRLAQNKSTPAYYAVEDAMKNFDFIDKSFLPQSQCVPGVELPCPPTKPLLRISFTFANRPRVLTYEDTAPDGKPIPKKMTTADNDDSDTEEYWSRSAKAKTLITRTHNPKDLRFEDGDHDDEENYENDSEDLINQVDQFHKAPLLPGTFIDIEMESRKGRAKNPNYQFCPPEHRLQILRLIAKAHALHPLLPERHGCSRTAGQIYRDSVLEMYTHCQRNNLREVWAYMWNSWYHPSKWALWARSAHEVAIPRKRTTMIVEALWKNLKRITLYQNNRPRMDFVVHLIATESIPSYRIGFANVIKQTRHSRSHNLTAEQKSFKRAWIRLSERPINGKYSLDTTKWTCGCGAQKYHTHLLCKHLVQSVPLPPNNWWPYATRAQVQPFYSVPTSAPYIPPVKQLRIPYDWLPCEQRPPPTATTSETPTRRHVVNSTTQTAQMPSTPSKSPSVLTPSVLVNHPVEPATNDIHSSPPRPTAVDKDCSLANGLTDGFQSSDVFSRIQRVKTGLLDFVNMLDSQGFDIDECFLKTVERRCEPALSYVSDIRRHEQRRTTPTTNGRDGVVGKSLVGYRYKNKENLM